MELRPSFPRSPFGDPWFGRRGSWRWVRVWQLQPCNRATSCGRAGRDYALLVCLARKRLGRAHLCRAAQHGGGLRVGSGPQVTTATDGWEGRRAGGGPGGARRWGGVPRRPPPTASSDGGRTSWRRSSGDGADADAAGESQSA